MVENSPWHQLIVLGNGFDLQCGLNSRFRDFFAWRLHKFPELGFYLQQELDRKTKGFWQNSPDLGRQLFDAGVTVWDIILASQPEWWVDVERMMHDFLTGKSLTGRETIQIELIRKYLHNAAQNSPVGPEAESYDPETDIECKAIADFLLADPQIRQESTRDTLLGTVLLDQLHDFENSFAEYLQTQIEQSARKEEPHRYKDRAYSLLGSLFFDELEEGNVTPDTSVLDFNYTNPLDGFTSPVRDLIHLANIHGDIENFNIVFGIDGKELMANTELVQFTKTYRLLELRNPDQGTVIHTATGDNGNPTNVIKFYGHSLGDADYSYFQTIFDGVNLYSSHTRLIFYFNVWPLDADKPDKLCDEKTAQQDMFRKVTRLLNAYGKTMRTNPDHGQNLMHKLLLEGRLSIIKYMPMNPSELDELFKDAAASYFI